MGQGRSTEGVNRRKYLSALAAAGGVSIAGCLGDDDDDGDGDSDADSDDGGDPAGERVPELGYEFTTGLGSWSQIEETTAGIASSNMEEALGVSVEPIATEATTYWEHIEFDTRAAPLYAGGFAPEPGGLDPHFFMSLYHIQYAGNQAGLNEPQYHSCEYADLLHQQFFATDEAEREQYVQDALEVFSADVPAINTFPVVGYTAANENQVVVDEDLQGDMGLSVYNNDWISEVETPDDSDVRFGVQTRIVNTNVHTQIQAPTDSFWWSTTIYSPLFTFDRNQEITPHLAEEVDISDDYSTFTFHLRDDATFHDGEPVTADDVKFTFNLYNNEYAIIGGSEANWESLTAIDDTTFEVSFDHARPIFMTGMPVYLYGIVPRHVWEPKLDDDFSNLAEISFENDEIVGSGPYELEEYEQTALLNLSPNEDHWATPNQNLIAVAFQDTQSSVTAFEQGNIDIVAPTGSQMEQLSQQDDVWTYSDVGFSIGCIAPQMTRPPGKFKEFRLAASQCINRQEANQAAAYGDSEPQLYSAPIAPEHPWYPDDHEGLTQIAESPTGDADVAEQTLADEDWEWDGDGNLHYPEGADLSPEWEEGSSPIDEPEEFPCVEEIPENYPA